MVRLLGGWRDWVSARDRIEHAISDISAALDEFDEGDETPVFDGIEEACEQMRRAENVGDRMLAQEALAAITTILAEGLHGHPCGYLLDTALNRYARIVS